MLIGLTKISLTETNFSRPICHEIAFVAATSVMYSSTLSPWTEQNTDSHSLPNSVWLSVSMSVPYIPFSMVLTCRRTVYTVEYSTFMYVCMYCTLIHVFSKLVDCTKLWFCALYVKDFLLLATECFSAICITAHCLFILVILLQALFITVYTRDYYNRNYEDRQWPQSEIFATEAKVAQTGFENSSAKSNYI